MRWVQDKYICRLLILVYCIDNHVNMLQLGNLGIHSDCRWLNVNAIWKVMLVFMLGCKSLLCMKRLKSIKYMYLFLYILGLFVVLLPFCFTCNIEVIMFNNKFMFSIIFTNVNCWCLNIYVMYVYMYYIVPVGTLNAQPLSEATHCTF